ncbi:MAG TPA: hypothetical protein VKB86_22765 [Pyrinomonadaceae bacterium]|nr:hypothetical protein [Pyrinomonadaceae bacterium]
MAAKRTAARAAASDSNEEPSKRELQRRMENAREEISETVNEIKETITDQYESVKETVVETLDWREQFRKHAVAWSLGAVAVGYIVGTGIAATLEDSTKKKGRKREGLLDEVYAVAETVSEELSGVARTILLPMLLKKVSDKFGIDLSEKLERVRAAHASKGTTKRSPAKRASSKKGGTKKRASGKRSAKKRG